MLRILFCSFYGNKQMSCTRPEVFAVTALLSRAGHQCRLRPVSLQYSSGPSRPQRAMTPSPSSGIIQKQKDGSICTSCYTQHFSLTLFAAHYARLIRSFGPQGDMAQVFAVTSNITSQCCSHVLATTLSARRGECEAPTGGGSPPHSPHFRPLCHRKESSQLAGKQVACQDAA